MVDGKEYPCRPTMGAMLRFKQETGRDVSEMTGSVSDLATYMWCCVVSACKREGVEFNMSLMDFADAITETDMNACKVMTKAKLMPKPKMAVMAKKNN